MIHYPILAPDAGVELDKPEQFLGRNFSSPNSRNVQLYNGAIESRMGLTKFSSTALPDPILHDTQYYPDTLTWFKVVATRRDICYYDFANARYQFINKQYTTGTIEVKVGELTKIYGTLTTWSTNLKAGDFIKIGSGSVHTGSTWYEIQSVDSDTLLTITSNAPITAAGSAYVARITFSGANTNLWDSVTFEDEILGTLLIMTNGIDVPVKWDASGLVEDIATLFPGLTAAKYVNVFKDRLIFLFVTISGDILPKGGVWSEPANCESYDATSFKEFIEGGDWIGGSAVYANYIIVFKERKAYIGRWVGEPYIFDWDISTKIKGTSANNSIIVTTRGVAYFGRDKKFRMTNIIDDVSISDSIFTYTREFNQNMEELICGDDFEMFNQLRWMVPYGTTSYLNAMVVYDYKNDIIEIWEYAHPYALNCIGSYLSTDQLYVDDAAWSSLYVDDEVGYWDARTFLANAPIFTYGGSDGYIRKADTGNDDDGYAFTRLFTTKRSDFSLLDSVKRLFQQRWWFLAESSGSVNVSICRDDRVSFDSNVKNISLVDATKDVVKYLFTWNKHATSFQFKVEATNFFRLLGFENWFH